MINLYLFALTNMLQLRHILRNGGNGEVVLKQGNSELMKGRNVPGTIQRYLAWEAGTRASSAPSI